MFDIGFTELLLIAVVALVVLGPERLPKAARFAGLWVRRARAQWFSVKSELERELAAEELKRSLQEARQAAARLEATIRAAGAEAESKARALEGGARREVDELRRGLGGEPSPRSDGPAAPEAEAALEADATPDAAAPTAGAGAADVAVATGDDVGTDPQGDAGDADATARGRADTDTDTDNATEADGGPPRQPDLPGVGPADMTEAGDGRQR